MEEKKPDKVPDKPVAEGKAAPGQGQEVPAGKEGKSPAPAGKVIDIAGATAGKSQPQPPKQDKPDADKGGQPTPAKDGPAKEDKPTQGKEIPGKVDVPAPGKAPADKGDKTAPAKGGPSKPQAAKDNKGRDKLSQGGKVKDSGKSPPDKGKATDKPPKDKDPKAEPPKKEPKAPPRPVEQGKLVYLKLSEMHAFHTYQAHPYRVRDDAKMRETLESIKENGVMTPGIARPEKDGNGYEIISGHRRHRACELAGLEDMPFIVREMSDHEAVQEMKDSNKQRPEILPTELAALLALEVEDIKHQGGRLDGVAEGDKGKRSVEIVGEAHNLNYKKVMRYIRLNKLIQPFKDLVDGVVPKAKKMGFMPAVELSYLTKKHQEAVLVSMEGEQVYPSLSQAQRLRELEKEGKLTGDVIDGILSEEKKEVDNVILNSAELSKFFGKEATPRQMKEQIMSLLDTWSKEQGKDKATPPKAQERD